MQYMECNRQDGILVLSLSRPPENTLNRPLVEELNAMVEEAVHDDGVRGLILASNVQNVFCGGFDVLEVSHYDRETMTLFFARFLDLYESLYLLPKPVVAAVSGQAKSWGALLALTADFRIFAKGIGGFTINEVDLGIALPADFLRLLAGMAGVCCARKLLLSSDAITPEQALAAGLANEVVEPGNVLSRSVALCGSLAEKPAGTFAALKRSLRVVSGNQMEKSNREALTEFMESWSSEEAEARRKASLASLNSSGQH